MTLGNYTLANERLRRLPTYLSLLSLFLNLATYNFLNAQDVKLTPAQQIGLPYIQNFSPEDYTAGAFNYDITQDSRGLIYVANHFGVLQYDGQSWRLIPVLNNRIAIAISIAADSLIYVGSAPGIGYLDADSIGDLKYKSLIEKVPQKYRDFDQAYEIKTVGNDVFFSTNKYLLRWPVDGSLDSMQVWPFENIYHSIFDLNNQLYAWQWGKGLTRMEGDSLQLVPGGETFAQNTIRLIAPISNQSDEKRILIGTVFGGLFIWDGTNTQDFEASLAIEQFLAEKSLYKSGQLRDGSYALASSKGGVAIMDSSGALIQLIDQEKGLGDNSVWNTFVDRDGHLWLTLNHGISRVEIPARFTFFEDELGLPGNSVSTFYYEDDFFTLGSSGVSDLSKPTRQDLRTSFQVRGSNLKFENMAAALVVDGDLLLGGNNGLTIVNGAPVFPSFSIGVICMKASRFHENLVYVGTGKNIHLLKKGEQGWKLLGYITGSNQIVRGIEEASAEQLWVVSDKEVMRFEVNTDFAQLYLDAPEKSSLEISPEFEVFDESAGLVLPMNFVHYIDGQLRFTGTKGFMVFDSLSQKFIHDASFPYTDTSFYIRALTPQPNGDIAFISRDDDHENGVANLIHLRKTSDGKYEQHIQDFHHMLAGNSFYFHINQDRSDPHVLWIAGYNGLIKYNPDIEKEFKRSFEAIIRKVSISGNNGDSVIYAGALTDMNPPELRYVNNSMRFEFAAPVYDRSSKTRFQYRLEGFDKDWSTWTDETKKDYTNLPEGSYQFKIRARDVFHQVGEEGVFTFSISPPWYRSWWAYSFYVILAILGVILITYLFNKFETQKLEYEKEQLEIIVENRTEEIQVKNEQLEETLHNLQKTQQQLIIHEKMASLGKMVEGIAHELKNPLNFVNNFAEGSVDLLDEMKEELDQYHQSKNPKTYELLEELWEDIRTNAIEIKESGQRADLIVSSMMDHANKNHGNHIEIDLNKLIEEHIRLAYHGYRKNQEALDISIYKDFDINIPPISINPQGIGRVLINILSNSFYALNKKREEVGINYRPSVDIRTALNGDQVRILIRDNGVGIPAKIKSDIFTPFFTTKPTGQGNTGLGLSLSYDIVTQGHQGNLICESEEGKFTEFVIILPLSN